MGKEDNAAEEPAEPTVPSVCEVRKVAAGDSALRIHPLCQRLEHSGTGPLLPLSDGRLLTADANGISLSDDGGDTWSATIPAAHGQDPTEPASCYLLETTASTLVMVYLDLTSEHAEAGELWIIPGFTSRKLSEEDPIPLGLKIRESDLMAELAGR